MIDSEALVAISVSPPDADELARLGLSDLHVRMVFTELVRHVLASGGCVAYGGRLDKFDPEVEEPNFTRIMLDMVSAYRPDLRPDTHPLVNFAASFFWGPNDAAKRAEFDDLVQPYFNRFQVEYCPAEPMHGTPADAAGAAATLSFTSMREQMAEQCAARVVVGGRLANYLGRYPGVIEEALLTAAASKPLFVAGGFGGCGAALAAHLRGDQVLGLTQTWQTEHTPAIAELAALLADSPYRLDLDADLSDLLPRGRWAALNNGLSDYENERLAVTTDVDEVVALVLRGLNRRLPANG